MRNIRNFKTLNRIHNHSLLFSFGIENILMFKIAADCLATLIANSRKIKHDIKATIQKYLLAYTSKNRKIIAGMMNPNVPKLKGLNF